MNKLKWISLAMLVLGLCSSQAQAATAGIGIAIEGRFLDETPATTAHEGDQIKYIVNVFLSLDNFQITNGEPELVLPDGTVINLDDGLTLGPGGSILYDSSVVDPVNGIYTLSLADLGNQPGADADEIRAVASVTALSQRDVGGTQPVNAATNWDTQVVELCIDVEKTVEPLVSKAGDEVLYTFVITNCDADPILESAPLSLDSVTDDVLGDLTALASASGCDPLLAAGDQCIFQVPYIVQPTDPDPLINTVTVVYHEELGSPIVATVTANDDAELDLVHPDFTVEKDCPESATVGETITYTITITNTGDVALDILSAVDSLAGSVPGALGILPAPGQIVVPYNYTVQAGDCPGEFTNTVTVIAGIDQSVAPLPNQLTRTDTCTTPCRGNPDTKVDIMANGSDGPITVCEGEQVTLTICEENMGDVELTDVYVEFSVNGVITALTPPLDKYNPTLTGDDGDGILQDDETWCWTVLVTPTAASTVYDAIGHGTDPAGNDVTIPDHPTEYDEVEVLTEPCGGEGCTPGFWKNNAENWNHSAWVGHLPSDSFSSVFGRVIEVRIGGNKNNTVTDPTLLQALSANGGQINALARAAVAALLNISSGCIQYGIGEAELISLVQQAIDDEDYSLAEYLDDLNNAGCPISQHQDGDCI